MSLAAGAAPSAALDLRRLGDGCLWLALFSGAIVMFEPAPYDLLMVALAAGFFMAGLRIRRELTPLVVLLILFNIGGLLALIPLPHPWGREPVFVAVSFFLAGTCIFLAAVCVERPERIHLVLRASIAAALLATVLGILGYALKIDALALYGRAKGAFKDPNVLGPFLVLPLVWVARDIMVRRITESWRSVIVLLALLAGVFFSFSRAAWALSAWGLLAIAFLVFVNERRPAARLRLIGLAALGVMVLVALFVAILSIDSVRDLFQERAKLVQNYDGARLGRFARHLIGFEAAMELPLGIGPYQFAPYFQFDEDPHNVYLKVLMTYGWLGFAAYVTLAISTLALLFPLLFKPSLWQGAAQTVFVVLIGHQAISWIIDTDHWRHFYILWALAWAMIAIDRMERRRPRARIAAPRPVRAAPAERNRLEAAIARLEAEERRA